MPEAPRAHTRAVLGLLLLFAGGVSGSAPPTSRPSIEPTLPLLVDVRLSQVERAAGRARGRLEIELLAGGDLGDIELSIALPGALWVTDGTALPPAFRMADRERRLLVLPLEGPDNRDLPIRLGGTFRTADGRTFRLGHGVTLGAPRPASVGRSYLGAWEVMAVPLEALRR